MSRLPICFYLLNILLVFVMNHAKASAVIWPALIKNAIRLLGRNKQMARGRLHNLCFTSKSKDVNDGRIV